MTRALSKSPPDAVQAVLSGYPDAARSLCADLRRLIIEIAAAHEVGAITETLKWGEPAFLTNASRAGVTIRTAWSPKRPHLLAVLVSCNSGVVDAWRGLYPELEYDGNRALRLPVDAPLPVEALRCCLEIALTWHRRKAR